MTNISSEDNIYGFCDPNFFRVGYISSNMNISNCSRVIIINREKNFIRECWVLLPAAGLIRLRALILLDPSMHEENSMKKASAVSFACFALHFCYFGYVEIRYFQLCLLKLTYNVPYNIEYAILLLVIILPFKYT